MDHFSNSRLGRWFWAVAFPGVILASVCMPATAQKLKEFDASYLKSPKAGPDLDKAARAIVKLTNAYRKELGLKSLDVNTELTRAAQYFAAYMARTNKFGHEADGNRPEDRATLFQYKYCNVAENIAYQSVHERLKIGELARMILEGWKASPPHRENLVEPGLMEIGVAIGYDPKSKRCYAVQVFGRPESAMIEFEVFNRATDTVHYTVAELGREKNSATFELPARARMHHSHCSPAKLDWRWTKADDNVAARTGRTYVIAKADNGITVTEQATTK